MVTFSISSHLSKDSSSFLPDKTGAIGTGIFLDRSFPGGLGSTRRWSSRLLVVVLGMEATASFITLCERLTP